MNHSAPLNASGFSRRQHAFLYKNGMMIDLGDLADGTNHSVAYGINAQDHIVGYGITAAGQTAFLRTDGALLNLNDITENRGDWWLAAAQGYLLDPIAIPEPSMLGIVVYGLLGLCALRRRSSQAQK